MKKALILVLGLLILTGSTVAAEEKYAGLSFEELQAEILLIQHIMWNSDDWQEVMVPAGAYEVGVDIPAGDWTISTDNNPLVYIGTKLDVTRTRIDDKSLIMHTWAEKESYLRGFSFTLSKGQFIVLDESVIFSPTIKGNTFIFR